MADDTLDNFLEIGKMYQLKSEGYWSYGFLNVYGPQSVFKAMNPDNIGILISVEAATYASFIHQYCPQIQKRVEEAEVDFLALDVRGYDWGTVVGMLVNEKVHYQFYRYRNDFVTLLKKLEDKS